MLRRLPILPTLLVLAAVAIMIRLGFWQLDRMHQKEALLARYAAAPSMPADADWPGDEKAAEQVLYRHARIDCREVTGVTTMAGQNAAGQSGLAQVAQCQLAGGGMAKVVLGWSSEPVLRDWRGGLVAGIIAPGPRLVAQPPLAGLEASAVPNPSSIPNNHFSYAVQWFLFAGVALIIYALAVRGRLRE